MSGAKKQGSEPLKNMASEVPPPGLLAPSGWRERQRQTSSKSCSTRTWAYWLTSSPLSAGISIHINSSRTSSSGTSWRCFKRHLQGTIGTSCARRWWAFTRGGTRRPLVPPNISWIMGWGWCPPFWSSGTVLKRTASPRRSSCSATGGIRPRSTLICGDCKEANQRWSIVTAWKPPSWKFFMKVWVQNCTTGAWDSWAYVLGQQGGGAPYSLFFPSTQGISCWFLRLKKKIGEEPKTDEQRRVVSNPPLKFTDPSLNPHPQQRSEQLLQKQKPNRTHSANVNKLSFCSIQFDQKLTVFLFLVENRCMWILLIHVHCV